MTYEEEWQDLRKKREDCFCRSRALKVKQAGHRAEHNKVLCTLDKADIRLSIARIDLDIAQIGVELAEVDVRREQIMNAIQNNVPANKEQP